jgi:two-component system, OmpR family, KDP operon response regulator KdpE
MRRISILIVDDEIAVLKYIQSALKSRGYDTLIAVNGNEALKTIEGEMPDIIILDVMMPGGPDGFEVCRRLREWSQIPIIMLSGRTDPEEKVRCLEAGADDYISKPFNTNELNARITAVLRRYQVKNNSAPPTQPVFDSGDLHIDFAARRCWVADNEIKLTPTEYTLLQEFVINAGKVLDHTYLLKKVWGAEYSGEVEYLRVFVNRLRLKLESNSTNHQYITTVPRVGYMFNNKIA